MTFSNQFKSGLITPSCFGDKLCLKSVLNRRLLMDVETHITGWNYGKIVFVRGHKVWWIKSFYNALFSRCFLVQSQSIDRKNEFLWVSFMLFAVLNRKKLHLELFTRYQTKLFFFYFFTVELMQHEIMIIIMALGLERTNSCGTWGDWFEVMCHYMKFWGRYSRERLFAVVDII